MSNHTTTYEVKQSKPFTPAERAVLKAVIDAVQALPANIVVVKTRIISGSKS